MWTRAELKNNAKVVLRQRYWEAFAAALVYGLLAGGLSGATSGVNSVSAQVNIEAPSSPQATEMATILTAAVGVLLLLSLLASIFVAGPMQVGLYRFYMENRERSTDFTTLFWGFTGGRYWKNVKVMLLLNIKIILWSLLLFIPGIIKTYEYYMVPYLLAENPELETARYFEISKGLTNGEKLDIWVLGLSFIGWELLGVLLCGIGTWFVMPYVLATDAELYALMRAKAFATDIARPDELRGFGPVMGSM